MYQNERSVCIENASSPFFCVALDAVVCISDFVRLIGNSTFHFHHFKMKIAASR